MRAIKEDFILMNHLLTNFSTQSETNNPSEANNQIV